MEQYGKTINTSSNKLYIYNTSNKALPNTTSSDLTASKEQKKKRKKQQMDRRKNLFLITCILVGTMATVAMATMEDDEKDCAEQLTNLAACIPFVSGTAKKPTPECCQHTDKVRTAKPKCLCVLIKESTDPSMGLPINTTLALQMPAACNIDAKVSDCPSILKLPADSPDAKIFQVAGGDSSTSSSSPASASPSYSSSTGSSADGKTTAASSNDGAKIAGSVFLVMGLALVSLVLV